MSRQRRNPLGDLHALATDLFVRCKIGKGAAKRILGRQIDGLQQITFFCGGTTGQTIGGEEVCDLLDAVRPAHRDSPGDQHSLQGFFHRLLRILEAGIQQAVSQQQLRRSEIFLRIVELYAGFIAPR